MPQLKIDWSPHEGQTDILNSTARFKVVASGRRWGKTECAAVWLIRQALSGSDNLVWWVGPGYEVTDNGWNAIHDILPEEVIVDSKKSKPRHIKLPNNSTIAFRSTNSDENVGVGLDALVLDEAAQISKRKFTRDLRPTLSDTLGNVMIISTPRGENWFHEYFQRGQTDDYSDYDSWNASTYDNPHVENSEVEAAKDDLPQRIFEQEYLAQFMDDSGGVFERVRQRIVEDYDIEEYQGTYPYRIGVDFARHQDHTVIIALDSENKMVHFDRLRNGGEVSWPQIQRKIEDVAEQYPGPVNVDGTRDNKIVSDLENAGISVNPVKFSPKKKTELIENLITRVEQESLVVPDIQQLVTEMQIFEYDTTRGGNVRYNAPEGFHDDTVDALALAFESKSRQPRAKRNKSYTGVTTV